MKSKIDMKLIALWLKYFTIYYPLPHPNPITITCQP